MLYLGIDPGNNGSLCCLDDRDKTNIKTAFSDYKDQSLRGYISTIRSLITQNLITLVALEEVHSMPKQGVKSTFTFGTNYGMIQGMLQALDVPYILVKPQIWQKKLLIPAKSDKKKIASIILNIYPDAPLYGTRGGLLDGRSDSLCLAHYAKLYHKGQT